MERELENRLSTKFHISSGALQGLMASELDAGFSFDTDLRITGWNTVAASVTGIVPEQAIKLKLADLFPALNQPEHTRALGKLLASGQQVRLQHLATLLSEGDVFFSASCYPLFSEQNTITGGYALLHPTSFSERGSRQLTQTSQLLELLAGQAGLAISRISSTGRFLEVSPALTALLGYSGTDLPGQPVADFLHPDDLLALQGGYIQVIDSKNSKPDMHRFRHKQGHYLWFESLGQSLRHPLTQLLQEVTVVSKPLATHAKLKEQEQQELPQNPVPPLSQAELALYASQAGTWTWNFSTEEIALDARMQSLFRFTEDEFDGTFESFLARVHPQCRSQVKAAMHQAIKNKGRFSLDLQLLTPANEPVFVHALGGITYLPNGVPDRILGLCLDVTEQKLAEETLRLQENELRNLYNNAPCGIGWFESVRDKNGRIVDFRIRKMNRAGAEIAGRTVEELVGANYLVEFPGIKVEGIFDEYVQVVETGKSATIEKVYTHENLDIHLIMQASPLNDGFVLTFTDVSEQMAVQRQLEAKQYLQAKINETAPSLIAVLNLNSHKVTYRSKTLNQFLGRKPEPKEPEGYDLLQHLLHPDDAAHLVPVMQQVASAADYDVLRFRFRFSDQQQNWHWYQTFVKVFKRNTEGHVEEVLCLVQDIDEAEQNKFLLKSTLDSSLSGIMAFEAIRNAEGQIDDFRWVLINKPAEQMIGRKSRYVMGRRMLTEMPGNLSEGIFDRFKQVVESGNPVQFEHFYTYKGCLTWFHISAVKMGDGFAATFSDITARKEAEWELLENKLFNEKIAAAAPFLISIYNPYTGKSLYYNRQLGPMLGYTHEELDKFAAEKYKAIVHPDDHQRLAAHFAALTQAKDGEVVETETRVRAADGQWKWLCSRDTAFRRDSEGKVIEVLSMISDVSEPKQKSDLLESVVGASPSGICALRAVRNQNHEIVDFT